MPKVSLELECPIARTFRVDQVAGMFDLDVGAKARASIAVDLPDPDDDWRIGAIVGPSGSGKSSVARAHFGSAVDAGGRWPRDRSVLDGFPAAASIRDITHTLTAVGFSSPPSWVKPYHVLSNGERFRCDPAARGPHDPQGSPLDFFAGRTIRPDLARSVRRVRSVRRGSPWQGDPGAIMLRA